MELIKTTSHQILLFKFDEIPFGRLVQKSSVTKLAELFDSGLVNVSDDGAINISGGLYKVKNKVLPIMRIVIEDRRVLIDLEGTSPDADAVVQYLTSYFLELVDQPRPNLFDPII